MGLQKYRADRAGQKQANGGTPWFSDWNWGPTLSLIRNCVIDNLPLDLESSFHKPRTVYITGVATTFFSIPAACRYTVSKRPNRYPGPKWVYQQKTLRGHVCLTEDNEFIFRAYKIKSARDVLTSMRLVAVREFQ